MQNPNNRGLLGHRLYGTWKSMHSRCNNPKHDSYRNYGGKGIRVCWRWHQDNPMGLQNFIDDMDPTFEEGLTLDRIDSNKGYSPENCRWATPRLQARGLRKAVIRSDGRVFESVREAERETGVNNTHISACCLRKKRYKTAGGFGWRFLTLEEKEGR